MDSNHQKIGSETAIGIYMNLSWSNGNNFGINMGQVYSFTFQERRQNRKTVRMFIQFHVTVRHRENGCSEAVWLRLKAVAPWPLESNKL